MVRGLVLIVVMPVFALFVLVFTFVLFLTEMFPFVVVPVLVRYMLRLDTLVIIVVVGSLGHGGQRYAYRGERECKFG